MSIEKLKLLKVDINDEIFSERRVLLGKQFQIQSLVQAQASLG